MDQSLSFDQVSHIIKQFKPDLKFKIITYDELDPLNNLDGIMNNLTSLIILYRTNEDYGHYVCLTKCDTPKYREYILKQLGKATDLPVYTFFDPYGLMIDSELKFVPQHLKSMLGEAFPKLKTLLIDSPNVVEWNDHHLQGKKSSTCGRWSAMRTVNYDVPLDEWVKQFKGKNPDKLIIEMSESHLNPNSMFGFSGGRKKRVKRESLTSKKRVKGSMVQNVTINLPSKKPRGEKPFLVPDERLSFKNPYIPPRMTYTNPKETIRPHQLALMDQQMKFIQHHADGIVGINYVQANALGQMKNMITSIQQNNDLYKAIVDNNKKFDSQLVGGQPLPGRIERITQDEPLINTRQIEFNVSTEVQTQTRPQVLSDLNIDTVKMANAHDSTNNLSIPIGPDDVTNTVPVTTLKANPTERLSRQMQLNQSAQRPKKIPTNGPSTSTEQPLAQNIAVPVLRPKRTAPQRATSRTESLTSRISVVPPSTSRVTFDDIESGLNPESLSNANRRIIRDIGINKKLRKKKGSVKQEHKRQ